jgi:predicted flap endonuclease-1-like 5' DNA nuclease
MVGCTGTRLIDSEQPPEEKSSQPQPPTEEPSEEQPPIERVRGIGSVFGQRLREQGVMWAEQFAQMDPGAAAGVLGVGLERAAELVKRAKEWDFDKG